MFLFARHILWISEPVILAAFQILIAFGHQRFVFLTAYFVYRLTEIPGNMEFIKGNLLLCTRQAFQRGAS